jgi:hypothetical protein
VKEEYVFIELINMKSKERDKKLINNFLSKYV